MVAGGDLEGPHPMFFNLASGGITCPHGDTCFWPLDCLGSVLHVGPSGIGHPPPLSPQPSFLAPMLRPLLRIPLSFSAPPPPLSTHPRGTSQGKKPNVQNKEAHSFTLFSEGSPGEMRSLPS